MRVSVKYLFMAKNGRNMLLADESVICYRSCDRSNKYTHQQTLLDVDTKNI
jgi:hypothetical protein